METVVFIVMLLTAFNFLLKQTFWKAMAVGILTAVCALFAALSWPYAIEQSKAQIQAWLSNQPLMLDTSVLLSVDVCAQMAYAWLAVHVAHVYPVKRHMLIFYRLLRWFPGLLIFPGAVQRTGVFIFAFPGTSFTTVAWCYAGFLTVAIPCGRYSAAGAFARERTTSGAVFSHSCPDCHLGHCGYGQRKHLGCRRE